MHTLVLGAGMAGLTCARKLLDAGHTVSVWDKARGPAGRMATRRSDHGGFDHGAPLFRARDAAFQSAIDSWVADGAAAPWAPDWSPTTEAEVRSSSWYVGMPRSSALLRHLASGLDCHFGERAVSVSRQQQQWQVTSASGHSIVCDAIVSTLPTPQALELLAPVAPELSDRFGTVRFHATWAVLGQWSETLPIAWNMHRGGSGPLHTVVRDGMKPGRQPGERLVLHAQDRWSDAHVEDDPDSVRASLLEALQTLVGQALPAPDTCATHRWRYAHAAAPAGVSHYWNGSIGLAGDWLLGAGVGAAWSSGQALADDICS